MNAAPEEPLFDPTGMEQQLTKGDRVTVQFSWGDETGTVVGMTSDHTFPMAMVQLDDGDRVCANVSRVRKE